MEQMDPIRRYKEARESLQHAASKLHEQGDFLSRVGVSLCAEEVGLRLDNSGLMVPIDVPHDCDVDYTKWPSREEIKSGLEEYYKARTEAHAAYSALPPDDQAFFAEALGDRVADAPRQRTIRTLRV